MARSSRTQGVAVAERGGWHSHSCARHGGGGATHGRRTGAERVTEIDRAEHVVERQLRPSGGALHSAMLAVSAALRSGARRPRSSPVTPSARPCGMRGSSNPRSHPTRARHRD